MKYTIPVRSVFQDHGKRDSRPRFRIGAGALRRPAALCGMILILGCISFGNAAAYIPMLSDPGPRINFVDSSQFDADFSRLLKTGPARVTARFIGTVSVNNIPERLDKWLSAVRYLGGRIDIQPEPETETAKILGEFIVSLAVGSYLLATHVLRYDPAMDYNAAVYYDRADGNLTRVVFTRKPDPPATRKDRIIRWFHGVVN